MARQGLVRLDSFHVAMMARMSLATVQVDGAVGNKGLCDSVAGRLQKAANVDAAIVTIAEALGQTIANMLPMEASDRDAHRPLTAHGSSQVMELDLTRDARQHPVAAQSRCCSNEQACGQNGADDWTVPEFDLTKSSATISIVLSNYCVSQQ